MVGHPQSVDVLRKLVGRPLLPPVQLCNIEFPDRMAVVLRIILADNRLVAVDPH